MHAIHQLETLQDCLTHVTIQLSYVEEKDSDNESASEKKNDVDDLVEERNLHRRIRVDYHSYTAPL